MTWEWLGPAAVTAIVAIVGQYFTWRAGKDTRAHAEHVAEQNSTATLKREREARRAAVYLDVLTMVNTMTAGANTITAVIRFDDGEETPFPSRPVQIEVNAKITLYGSQAVRDHYKTWFDSMNRMMQTHIHLQVDAEAMEPGGPAKIRKRLEAQRQEMIEAAKQLAELMNSELATLPHFPDLKAIDG